ncbi:CHASE3 domain-containing protein [Rhodocytophaga aerolata]|uniref:histidine kinase n=1 Tax=Rhodocytophaga aerolata TaxID=455078 RepID=A0ABT8R788_9BACT|nr:sensor histidine kinase [Rhodocytophaga aerolata]MDO1446622.1 CHASE3 domain-containing protein [Rhodocytophaga aerolata]
MKNRLKTSIYLGISVAFLLIAVISFFYYKSTNDFIQSSRQVQQSTLRSRQLERVLSLLKDAETGQRGYIITQQESFLEPYLSATAHLHTQTLLLKQLTANLVFYQDRVPLLDSLISQQISVLNGHVTLVKQGHIQQATARVASGKAKKLLDAIRANVGEMQAYEEGMMLKLQEEADRDVLTNYWVNYIGIILTVSIFAIGFRIITGDLSLREKLEKALNTKNEELKGLNEELEALNEELKAALEEANASNEKIKEYSGLLEEKNHTLEFLNKELEAFSYTVSHDLQSPLHTISGFAGLLSQTPALTADQEASRQLEVIERSAARMDGLINDLLRFSRVGKTALQKANFNMLVLVEQVLADLKERTALEPIQFTISQLPQVMADKKLLYQVWINLLSNAIKFSAKVAIPFIEIGCYETASFYTFWIKDNGVGFHTKQEDPFGVFKRLHRKEDYPGSGIGLAIVQRIIERHGGETWAHSSPGNGATFYFTLPRPEET